MARAVHCAVAFLGVCAILAGTGADALTGREVIAEAQARNAFSTRRDRRSVVRVQGFENGPGTTREMEVYERTDSRGEHRSRIEFLTGGGCATNPTTRPSSARATDQLQPSWKAVGAVTMAPRGMSRSRNLAACSRTSDGAYDESGKKQI